VDGKLKSHEPPKRRREFLSGADGQAGKGNDLVCDGWLGWKEEFGRVGPWPEISIPEDIQVEPAGFRVKHVRAGLAAFDTIVATEAGFEGKN